MRYKEEYGARWLLLFYHMFTVGSYMTLEEAKSSNSPGKYSILWKLSKLRRYGKEFEFLFEYPESNLDYIRWTQTANPIETRETSTLKSSLGTVINHSSYSYFRGLALSIDTYSYIDGDGRTLGDFWYCIGLRKGWMMSNIPGPINTAVDQVMLWLRVPLKGSIFRYFSVKHRFTHILLYTIVCTKR